LTLALRTHVYHVSPLQRESSLKCLPHKTSVPCFSCGEDSAYAIHTRLHEIYSVEIEYSFYHTLTECENCYKKRTVIPASKIKHWIRERKASTGCIICDEHDPRCLEFHHRNPKKKKFSIGSVPLNTPKRIILREIEKCVVLCANCHRKIDHGIK
jgi:hypothetical protein